MSLPNFHPAVAAWFESTFDAPTPAQAEAWPAIRAGRNVLIAAPTGSGKTLAAFLAAIDALVRQGIAGTLADETQLVYVSPLKALSNDVRINLEVPLEGIRAELAKLGLPDVEIRTAVRTGDTPQAERNSMRRRPPHIAVTTPESLYILLGSNSGRRMLATTRSVIVDEIHAVVQSKRGSHLALTLERLDALCGQRCTRIGLSATQKPIETVADFLVGNAAGLALASPLPQTASPSGGEGWVMGQEPRTGGGESTTPNPVEVVAGVLVGTATGFALASPLPQTASLFGGEGWVRGRTSLACDPRDAQRAPSPTPQASPPTTALGERECCIIDSGHARARDLAIELTAVPLQAVMSNDAWSLVYDRLAELIGQHRTTLVFSNTRRGVERTTRHLAERLGNDAVAAHHGSLSKEKRLDAEQRLKAGRLRALVATASLELGIDIGEVDLVCQLSSPRSIASFLQRAGRAGHAVDGISKARLFPTSRDDLAECVALLDSVRRGELDTLRIPPAPLDVLAQQTVAEVACGECDEAELFATFRRAYPYRTLTREAFTDVVRMLADGYATRRGTRAAWLHRDAVHGKLRARRGARLVALTSGGAIPDTADYDVMLEPQDLRVGSVNEDFAVESMAGDIFQLGNQSYKIRKIERGRVRVEDAKGAPPSIPFWLGEAPGRSDELSAAVSRLREEISARLHAAPVPCSPLPQTTPSFGGEGWVRGASSNAGGGSGDHDPTHPFTSSLSPDQCIGGEGAERALTWLVDEVGVDANAARQLVDYYATARNELGLLPTQSTLAMERFFDEAGGMQLVIHSPLGSRLNRAWGLALRKRFCRSFNFELQATATEDAIVLSLSTSHSFPLEEVARYLHSNSVSNVLTQALLDAPMFALRFRWNASAALALPRFAGGRKVPPPIQRMKSDDLLATVFPDQVACLENIVGDREIPDHPLVAQTLRDCLRDAMDLVGLVSLLTKLERGEATIVARDLAAPSALAAEILGARPYAFLDGGEIQERRTQAATAREALDPAHPTDLGVLDVAAIDAVRAEAWPEPRDADEMHEALLLLGAINGGEAERNGWNELLAELAQARRATRLSIPCGAIPPLPRAALPCEGEGGGEGAGSSGAVERTSAADPNASNEPQRCSAIATPAPSPNPLPHLQMGERASMAVAAASIGETASPILSSAGRSGERTSPSQVLWVAAELLPPWQAIHPEAGLDPVIDAPAEFAARAWTREEALPEILRARLGGSGVTDAATLAATLAIPPGDIEVALAALEREGTAMRGRFDPRRVPQGLAQGCANGSALDADPASVARLGRARLHDAGGGTPHASADEQWCDRALLARIHRRTIQRRRREIEPVPQRDFMRFLIDWQHVSPRTCMRGPDALAAVLAQLEGYEAAAAAWEPQLLASRITGYDGCWLDALCGAGRITWARLRVSGAGIHAGPVRASPIVLVPRSASPIWRAAAAHADADAPVLSSRARAVAEFLAARGASFFSEIADATRLLQVELEDALGELVAAGIAGADSFAGLRALLRPAGRRRHPRQRRLTRHLLNGIEDAGRWSLVKRSTPDLSRTPEGPHESGPSPLPLSRGGRGSSGEMLEHIARVLLRRWGVVFWKLLEREAAWLPPWRDLRRVLQRLEARGEIRGGRFVAGIEGEQFALPEAVAALRTVHQREPDGAAVCVSGADPLNLAGIVLPGAKVPALASSRIVYRDGVPIATRIAGEITLPETLAPAAEHAVHMALRRSEPAPRRARGALTRAL